jgi:hypothetical protein
MIHKICQNEAMTMEEKLKDKWKFYSVFEKYTVVSGVL